MTPPNDALEAIVAGRHDDSFSLLGAHAGPQGTFARAWVPGADTAEAHDLAGTIAGRR